MTRTTTQNAAEAPIRGRQHRCGTSPDSLVLHAVRNGGGIRPEAMCGRRLHPFARRRAADAGSFEARWLHDACCLDCGKIIGLDPPTRGRDQHEHRDWFAVAPPVLLSAIVLGAFTFRLILVAVR